MAMKVDFEKNGFINLLLTKKQSCILSTNKFFGLIHIVAIFMIIPNKRSIKN